MGNLRSVLFGMTAATILLPPAPPAHAVDIRDLGGNRTRYQAQLTRAYAPCLAPNDQTSEGVPACSPPVGSVCTFGSAALDVRELSTERSARVRATVKKLGGPSPCDTGVFTLKLTLRATSDDPACTGGSCTFTDVTVAKAFERFGKDGGKLDFALEQLLPPDLANTNLEILNASISDPNDVPLATAGLGIALKAKSVQSNLTVTHPRCTAPNTTGALGTACAPPLHDATCDFESAHVAVSAHGAGIIFGLRALGVVGPPQCLNGTYVVRATMRVTNPRCGSGAVPCTAVDQVVDVAVPASDGKLAGKLLLAPPGLVGQDRKGKDVNVELPDLRLVEPDARPIATAGIGLARRLSAVKVTISRRNLKVPDDDTLRVDAVFPNAAVDPSVGAGATFELRDADGVFYAATIPAASWAVRPRGHWSYRDHTGADAGIINADVKTKRHRGKVSYKTTLIVRNVALAAADRPSVTVAETIAASGGAGDVTAERNRVCKISKQRLRCR